MNQIKTAEQLPKKDQQVLGIYVGKNGWIEWLVFYFDGDCFVESSECRLFSLDEVPYWFPLPPLPPELTKIEL